VNSSQTLGWTLVHSVWEIAAISMLFCVVRLASSGASAKIRYVVALSALALCLVAPVTTFFVLTPAHAKASASLAARPAIFTRSMREQITNYPAAIGPYSPVVRKLGRQIDPILPTIVICWLLGLCLMCLRLAGGLWVVERMKRKAMTGLESRWQELSDSLASRMRIRRPVPLMESANLSTPAVIGFFKATILLPAGMVTKLTVSDVEALLAHELAHIQRFDYVVNFAQSVLEAVLFYHPGVWWISAVVRAEREHCCDDAALAVLDDREQYARALMSLEQLRVATPRLAMAAARGSLLTRIRRIVLPQQRRITPASAWATIVLAVAISVGLAGSIHARRQDVKRSTSKPAVGKEFVGQVIDLEDHPVAGATVLAAVMSYTPGLSGPVVESTTDANGEFHLQQGQQCVAFKQGLGFGIANWRKGKPAIRLLPVKPLHVHVVDRSGDPIAGVTIGPRSIGAPSNFASFPEDSEMFARMGAKTDAAGDATIEYIPATGSVLLSVADDQFTVQGRTGFLKARPDDREVKLVLVPAGQVEGTVTGSRWQGIGKSIFAIRSDDQGRGLAFAGPDGHFQLKHLPAGEIFLQARPMISNYYNWSSAETHLTVVPGKPQHVDLRLDSGIPTKIRIVQRGTHPIEGLNVSVLPVGERGLEEAAGRTDKDGEFQCFLTPGSHRIEFEQWTRKISQVIDVREGDGALLTFHAPIDEPDARIVCKLFDADGKPLGATTVVVECTDFDGKHVKQDWVTSMYGKAVVFLPQSRVKSMYVHAKSGSQVSDPIIRPKDGVAEVHLHRQ